MSFRELRNFTEMMRALGYPRLVSVENFRTPNFQLVAHCLDFLVHRYDPHINVTDEIDTEDDRVEFINSVCNAMRLKAALKLKAKSLYAADGRAVRELSKVAKLLYDAQRHGQGGDNVDMLDETDMAPALGAKAKDIKGARALASEITDRGAKLFDLLGQERELRAARTVAMRFLDKVSSTTSSTKEHTLLERQLNDLLQRARDDIKNMESQAQALQDDERALDAKIKKKQQELERGENRLQSLKSVRPAFMDEYERLEAQLEQLYTVYLERFRNLDYLEHELSAVRQSEQAKVKRDERQLKRMQKRLREEDLAAMRGEADAGLGGRPFGGGGGGFGSRPDGAGGMGRMGGRVQGGMRPDVSDSPSGSSEDDSLERSSELSSDSGSDGSDDISGDDRGHDSLTDDDSPGDDSLVSDDDDGPSDGSDFNSNEFGDGMDSDNDF